MPRTKSQHRPPEARSQEDSAGHGRELPDWHITLRRFSVHYSMRPVYPWNMPYIGTSEIRRHDFSYGVGRLRTQWCYLCQAEHGYHPPR